MNSSNGSENRTPEHTAMQDDIGKDVSETVEPKRRGECAQSVIIIYAYKLR